ncbi:MAG: gamma-glutamyltransferase, partial [Bacteroidia bacterium]|nr:gamma-glutamyltransferase [Bacteroidia bacterium]
EKAVSIETVDKPGTFSKNAMVVSAREEASKIGVATLKKGGNVFDALMATEMALSVTYPFAGSIGGGGFLVYRLADGEKGALDYREKAPLASNKDMYLDEDGEVIEGKSTIGGMAVGVPGGIAGIFEAHQKFGNLEIEDILKPVIELATNGYVVTQMQHERFLEYDSLFVAVNGKPILYSKQIKPGDTIRNLKLAETLTRIATNGRDEFYKGKTAEILVDFLQNHDGIITLDDLSRYQAKWRKTIEFRYDNYNVISMPPPSSGGICLGQIMTMLEPFDLKDFGHNSVKYIQALSETEKRAYADRSYYLGDPDFVEIPTKMLLSHVYAQERMADFTFEAATPSDSISYGRIAGFESDETTHYSIVDQFGNAIAVTVTLNGAYGSKLFIDELGFFLNNEMDDFSSKPGVPNMFGLLGAEANSIAPEKRMLSSMTPTLVEKDGELFMSVGTPGGSTIITSVLQTILNVVEFNMPMQKAIDQKRFHHQWLPDEIRMEPNGFPKTTIKTLNELGYKTNESRSPIIGKVNGILILDDGTIEGGADKRGDDTAIGY